eukprot:TRINITY_DN141_c0_g1_i1.p1 TRINITY_DN141_c0_g1~~TRINITY_DN141_c0_g1_i1.p1  ORF type:complete len:352 (-),score=80.74 TRINITY_DN141_c0_g1_i1:113-1168(-)
MNSVNFNQDASRISVGTSSGFRIYECHPFKKIVEYKNGEGCGISEMVNRASLIALAGHQGQTTFRARQLRLFNTTEQKTILERSFHSPILSIKINSKRLLVVLEHKILIFDLATMKNLHTVKTNINPEGLCALCPDDSSYLAYPGASGSILIFDALSLNPLKMIENAHKGTVSVITFNSDGSLLATASNKGTLIRLWSTVTGEKVQEFRRGAYPAAVYSIAFSQDSSLICASSESGTIHLWNVNRDRGGMGGGEKGRNGGGSTFGSLMPGVFSNMWEAVRDFAQVKILAASKIPTLCGIYNNECLCVVSADGFFYRYLIDTNKASCEMLGDRVNLFQEEEDDEEVDGEDTF